MKKKIIIAVFIALFVGVALFVYFGQKSNRAKELFYSGTIETTQAKLSFQVPGRVAEVNVQEGQSVKKDQIVAQLDRVEFEAR
ncbi:MAG TPA: biotin/lipoyl-binding protein, partial [Smithellaceae bacterium]